MRPRSWLAAALATLGLVAAVGLPTPATAAIAPASPVCAPRAGTPAVGLSVVGSKQDGRLLDLSFASKALGGSAHVAVLLPEGYDANQSARYPVLYLLHGHGGNGYQSWPTHDVAGIVGPLPLIVVMPEGGYDGWYFDWYGSDLDGHSPNPRPAWESFHLRELLPWVDRHLRTVPRRRARAIAGLSMGGFGAMSYAARHPDLFVAAGEFSGAVDSDLYYPVGPVAQGLAANLPDGRPPDHCVWGDPVTQQVVWRDHDPTELAANLRGLSLFLASGDGRPGRHDQSFNPGASFTEAGIFQMNTSFERALTDDGIGHATWFYGPGTHSWPYWQDDLRRFLPRAMAAFARPPPEPPDRSFTYRSAATGFAVWGWSFSADRDAPEFTYLGSVGRRGLTVAGSGRLHVDTAPLYQPGGAYRVNATARRADSRGRLHFAVDLGPAHPTAQQVFGVAGEAAFTRMQVKITPSR